MELGLFSYELIGTSLSLGSPPALLAAHSQTSQLSLLVSLSRLSVELVLG